MYLVAQSCPTLCDPMDCSLPDSSVHGILQVRILEWVAMTSPGDLPDPGINPRSPALQEDSLPSEPSEKPKNTGMSSLSLLQGNFPTQELNRGLLHCRWILYQLSYLGSPTIKTHSFWGKKQIKSNKEEPFGEKKKEEEPFVNWVVKGKRIKGIRFRANMTKESHTIREHSNTPLSQKRKHKFTKYLDFAKLTEEGAIKIGIS